MKKVIERMANRYNKCFAKYKWRKQNPHNLTRMVNYFRAENVIVGNATYGMLEVIDYSPENNKVLIGNYCSIAPKVIFVLGGEHELNTLSTYPFKTRVIEPGKLEAGSKGNIIVKDDVWIGVGATIMSGVTIGQGAVIGANSLVNKDVPAYAIVGGVPARIIKYRFTPNVVGKLIKLDYTKFNNKLISQNANLLYQEINDYNIDDIIAQIVEN